jgi:hypothetical protein
MLVGRGDKYNYPRHIVGECIYATDEVIVTKLCKGDVPLTMNDVNNPDAVYYRVEFEDETYEIKGDHCRVIDIGDAPYVCSIPDRDNLVVSKLDVSTQDVISHVIAEIPEDSTIIATIPHTGDNHVIVANRDNWTYYNKYTAWHDESVRHRPYMGDI